MSVNQHSPGPWSEETTMSSDFRFIRYIVDDDGRVIAEVRYAKDAEQAENLANAKLIAAAPKLLELLRKKCNPFHNNQATHDEVMDLLEHLEK